MSLLWYSGMVNLWWVWKQQYCYSLIFKSLFIPFTVQLFPRKKDWVYWKGPRCITLCTERICVSGNTSPRKVRVNVCSINFIDLLLSSTRNCLVPPFCWFFIVFLCRIHAHCSLTVTVHTDKHYGVMQSAKAASKAVRETAWELLVLKRDFQGWHHVEVDEGA